MITAETIIERALQGTKESVMLNNYIRLTYFKDRDKLTAYIHIISKLPPMMKKIKSREPSGILEEISDGIRQYMGEYAEMLIKQLNG